MMDMMDIQTRKGYFIALFAGLLGMALFQVSWHIYLDHLFIDALRSQIQQQQIQQQQKPAEK